MPWVVQRFRCARPRKGRAYVGDLEHGLARVTEPTAAPNRLRSRAWFDNPHNPDMTALYIERYMNFGISLEEIQSGRPIIGIAQSGSDLVPCMAEGRQRSP